MSHKWVTSDLCFKVTYSLAGHLWSYFISSLLVLEIYSNGLGLLARMATMPILGMCVFDSYDYPGL